MLVSHRHRFIYTKTGKTAGTSVERRPNAIAWMVAGPSRSLARSRFLRLASWVFADAEFPKVVGIGTTCPAALIREGVGSDVWESYVSNSVSSAIRTRKCSLISISSALLGSLAGNPHEPDSVQFEQWLTSSGVPLDRDKYVIDGQFCLDFGQSGTEALHADLCGRLFPIGTELGAR